MREILFRGKRKDNGKWVYGGYHKWETRQPFPVGNDELKSDETKHVIVINSFADWGMPRAMQACEIIPETLGQYTGLTDKNGVKIFEGDIIRYADSYDYRMYVESLEAPEEYEGVNFNYLWTIDKVIYGININYPAFDLNKHDWEVNGLSELSESGNYFYEVIGNIHDNPELLEVV